MKNLRWRNSGVYKVVAASDINNTIAEAITLAAKKKRMIKFEFNDVIVSVRSNSDPGLICRDLSRALSGYIGRSVGPNPNPVLTDEEKARDVRIKTENDRADQKRQAKYKKKARVHREAVEAKLVNAPSIELADEVTWQKFKENYQDGAVITYSERWARLMQVEMAQGKNLEDVANAMHYEADLEGISGYQYGCAVLALSQCWKYGEKLRRWHNLKVDPKRGEEVNESGGVLNSAILLSK